MDITRIALEKRYVTLVAIVVILIVGVDSYLKMPRSEDPGFIIRVAQVRTFFPGASPERMELLVTDKLEKTIQEIPELDFVSSTSKVGSSVITVSIKEQYKDMRPIWDNLRRKVDAAQTELPKGIIGPFVNDEFGDVFGIIIGLTGDGFDYAELKEVADELRDELLRIPDVAKVNITGEQKEQVYVEYDNARLTQFGLSPLQLGQILQKRNIILPGGDLTSRYEKIVLEPTGNFTSINDLRQTIINIPGSREVVRLQDVVAIYRSYVDPPVSMMHTNGLPSLGLAVSLREGGNILALGDSVKTLIQRANTVYPIGIEFEVIQFQPDAVARKINDFVSNLVQAVVIVTLVMLLSLGLRTGLIVASLIPSAIIASFFFMDLFGIGLNQVSLAALMIALGMLVDNAIVISESIMVRMEKGDKAKTAAIASALELKIPLLISSLTTAAAFLPIYLAESNTGEYTSPLFKVVTITLLCSWGLALTLIPLLCVTFLKVKPATATDTFNTRFYKIYRLVLLKLSRWPILTLVCVGMVFILSIKGLDYVPKIFFPKNDRPTFTAELEFPEGTPIQRTEEVVSSIEGYIQKSLMINEDNPSGIVNWSVFIGEGAPRFILPFNPEPPTPNYAIFLGNTTDHLIINPEILPQLEDYIRSNFPDVNPTLKKLPLGAPAWPPLAIRISGRDTDKLFAIVDEVKSKLREIPGAKSVTDNWGARSKKIVVHIDEARARMAGVSHEDIAISLQTYLTGIEITDFREDDKLIPIVLRSKSRAKHKGTPLGSLNVYAQATGKSVPITQVAEPEIIWQPGLIERRNRLRTVTVEALLKPGYTVDDVLSQLQPWIEEKASHWPFGFEWEFGGEAETSGKANKSIADKLPIAVLIILLLLVGQFNSLLRPLIILLTIPLALIGVTFGLLVTHSYFGFVTLLGIISLSGIVINNAIVLLDRIRIEIENNGLAPARAVIEAAQQRLRPILLTTATTIGGLLPLWLGGGPMWEPMAISIIFGLLFATVLTLGIVPVLYGLFYKISFKDFRY